MSKERWASRVGLVLAMAGNAVGLGNFLRFPAQAAANGGGAFMIPYVVALLVMGLPLIWVEWAMGRYGGQHGHHCTPGIFQVHGRNPVWKYVGTLGLWSCLVIASYYLYIESWCLTYAFKSLVGGFSGMTTSAEVEAFFNELTGKTPNSVWAISPWGLGVFAFCAVLNVFILSRGLAKGIEIVCKIGMPMLITFAALLAIRGLLIEPAEKTAAFYDANAIASPFVGLNFLWEPQFGSLSNPSVWLAAAGQIFFTLSIGMGSIHCYSSYLREEDDVALTGASAAWTNEFCEVILGGTILLPIAVAYLGLPRVQEMTQAGSGFGLGFMVFPTLFNNWGGFAPIAGFLWFGLLFFAAITSSLAMGQPIMALLQSEYNCSRPGSAVGFGLMLAILAVPVAIFTDESFNAELDYWAGTLMLVVFALAESILFAWVFGIDRGWQEINNGSEIRVPIIFRYIIRYVTPVFLMVILFAYVFKPAPDWGTYLNDWFAGKSPEFSFAADGMVGKLMHKDLALADGASEEQIAYTESLKFLRNVGRWMMLGVYFMLCVLVAVGWRRRNGGGVQP